MSYLGRSSEFGVRSRFIYTAAGSETSITGNDDNNNALSFTDGAYVDVYLNGVLLVPGTDYNTTTANTIGSLAALAASDVVEVVVYDTFQVADTVPASTGGTFNGNITANAFYGDGSNLTGLAASFSDLTDATVATTDPTVTSNPGATGHLWLNKTSGELYVCTSATNNANTWTNVGEGAGSVTPTYTVNYLLVAGGGGGGNWSGGAGGGAGGLLTGSITLTTGSGTTYSFEIGAGGAGSTSNAVKGTSGEDTTAFSQTAIGGGGGGSEGTKPGLSGGSGGGGGYNGASGGSGTSGQGNNGGNGGGGDPDYTGGGGGGAGGAGENGGTDGSGHGGDGGIGATNTLINTTQATSYSVGEVSGSNVYYSGGGGGGSQDGGSAGVPGDGGIGGGGDGGAYGVSNGQNASVNSGGGGGGGRAGGSGGSGASGVVILRMPTARYSGTTTGSPTVTTDGTDTIIIFKSSGSYTA